MCPHIFRNTDNHHRGRPGHPDSICPLQIGLKPRHDNLIESIIETGL